MKGELLDFPKQFTKGLEIAKGVFVRNVDSCVLLGMGGSALHGDLLNAWKNIGMKTHRDYGAPELDSRTLAFACSYSGNTEESLSAFHAAIDAGAKVVVMTHGGKLKEEAIELGLPLVLIPDCVQPRCAIGYFFSATAAVLEASGLLQGADELRSLEVTADEESAKEMAAKLKGSVPIIYSSNAWQPIARICKIKFNENSKVPAFYNTFPEVNHNEMVGFTRPLADYTAIFLRDEADNERVKKRMSVTRELYESKGLQCIDYDLRGASFLEKAFSTILQFDWVSFHLALAYGIDPAPVEMVEEFKKKIEQSVF